MATIDLIGALFSAVTLGTVALAVAGWANTATTPAGRRRAGALAALALLGWLGVTGLLAARGALSDFAATPPRATPVIVLGNLAAILVAVGPLGRRLIAATPLAWLVGYQVFRVGVEIVLDLLYHAGVVPVQMSFEGRNWDILVGLSALPIAWLAARGRLPRLGLLLWNIAGLGLLLNIVVVSVLSMPTPLRAFPAEPANTFITSAPYIWLPAFLVPAALLGHLLVFRHLLAGAPRASRFEIRDSRFEIRDSRFEI
jgi:hypothetical protein